MTDREVRSMYTNVALPVVDTIQYKIYINYFGTI